MVGILEQFNTKYHGYDSTSTPEVLNRFLVYSAWERDNISLFLEALASGRIAQVRRYIYTNTVSRNPGLRGFQPTQWALLLRDRYLSPDVFKLEIMAGGETVGYPIGTFWLSVFQRRCRRIVRMARARVERHRQLRTLLSRETGIIRRSGRRAL
jgi:hypothetical protein